CPVSQPHLIYTHPLMLPYPSLSLLLFWCLMLFLAVFLGTIRSITLVCDNGTWVEAERLGRLLTDGCQLAPSGAGASGPRIGCSFLIVLLGWCSCRGLL